MAFKYIESVDFEAAKNYLTAHPDEVNEKYFGSQTCLMVACEKGNPPLINWLLTAGADLDLCDKDDFTALHHAVYSQQLEAVTILIKRGSKVNWKNKYGVCPLHMAAGMEKECKDVVAALLQSQEVMVNQRNNFGRTPLHWACLKGYTDTVSLLLHHTGVDANVVDMEGNTPLHLAVQSQYYDVVTLMLSQDSVKFDVENYNKLTPFLQAVAFGHLGMIHKLIVRGANVNAVDNKGNNCLHLALQGRAFHSEVEQLTMLDKNAFKLSLDKKMRSSNIVVASYLFYFGAKFYHPNKEDVTPLDLIQDRNLKTKLQAILPPPCTYCQMKDPSKFQPCGHSALCRECYMKIKCETCPTCQQPISGLVGFGESKLEEKEEVQTVTEPVGESKFEEKEEVQTVTEPVGESKLEEKEEVQTVTEPVEKSKHKKEKKMSLKKLFEKSKLKEKKEKMLTRLARSLQKRTSYDSSQRVDKSNLVGEKEQTLRKPVDESHCLSGSHGSTSTSLEEQSTSEESYAAGRDFDTDSGIFSLYQLHSQVDERQVQSKTPTSENKLHQVESPELNEELLNNVAQHLGGKWQQVGKELGIKTVQLEVIKRDNLYDTKEQSYKMLFKWFTKCDPGTRTLKTLRDALKKTECYEALNCLPQTK